MSDQETFPVGARVRKREGWPTCVGEVISPLDGVPQVCVRWDGGVVHFYEAGQLERLDKPSDFAHVSEYIPVSSPPRAPARTLAPGVESRPDVQGGKPCLAGTRTPTDVVRGWRDWADFAPHFPHVTEPEYDRAVLFEAGIAWERERRRRRKEKRAVRRWLRVKALAEGKVDDRG